MKRSIILLGIGLLLSTPALAIEPEYGPRQGDWEVAVGANSVNDEEWVSSTWGGGLTGSLGYFLTDDLEVALRQSILASGARGTKETAYLGSTRIAVDYHIPLGRFYPFIGANFGTTYGDVHPVASGGPEAGVKYWAVSNAFLYTMAEYNWFTGGSSSQVGNAYDDGLFLVTVGMGMNF